MRHKGRLLMVAGLFLLLAAGCAPKKAPLAGDGGESPYGQPAGELYVLEEGALSPLSPLSPLSDEGFIALAKDADYVLLGEGHTVACDHLAQARLLRMLGRSGRDWALGLEMLSADLEPELEPLNRAPSESAADLEALERALRWKEVWGYPFELYAPALQAALEEGMPLVALNVPRRVLVELRRKGREGLAPEQLAWLPKEIIPPTGEQKEDLRKIFTMHQDFLVGEESGQEVLDERLERFFLVQSIWDSAMAQRAAEARDRLDRPVAILAGAGHVEQGWGIAHRLKKIDPDATVLLVMPWRGGEPPAPEAADVFFHCQESHRDRLGMTLVQDEEREHVVVLDIAPDSPAARADLRPGDVILEAGGAPVASLGDLHKAGMRSRRSGEPLRFVILRNGYRLLLTLPRSDRSPDRSSDSPTDSNDTKEN